MECITTWMSSVKENNLPSPHQTLPGMQFDQTQQMGYYDLQQKNFVEQPVRLKNPPTFFQPVSGSFNLQSNQAPLAWSSGSQSHLSSASGTPYPSNNELSASSQVETPIVDLSYFTPSLNSNLQRNYTALHSLQNANCTTPHFSFPSVSSNEKRYCTAGSIPPWQHLVHRQSNNVQTTFQPATQSQQAAWTALSHAAPTINMNHGPSAGQHSETPRVFAGITAASHMPVDSLVPLEFKTSCSHISQSQVPKALCQPSSHRNYDGHMKLNHCSSQTLPCRTSYHSNQRLNNTLPILTQDKIQSQTTPFSGHHSRTNAATFSAIQNSTQIKDLHSNTDRGLTAKTQDITSLSTSTSPATSLSGCTTNSHKLLLLLLQQSPNRQLTGLTASSNSFGSQSAKSKSGSQKITNDSTTGHITTGENYMQGLVRQGKEYKGVAKVAGILTGNEIGNHLAEPQKSSQKMTTNWKKRNKKQSCTDLSDSLKLRMVHVNKIAVVSPISQQASSHGQQNDVSTSPDDSLFSKTDTVKKTNQDCENMDKQTIVPNVTLKVTEHLPHVPSSPGSSPRLGSIIDTSANISEVSTSKNVPTSGFQSCDFSQCKNDSVSTIQISNKCQNAVCVGSISKSSVEQNDDQEVESSSEKMFNLSTVPVVDYTLKELKDLVNSLEVKPTERDKSTITNVIKCIIDLYYDGNKQNFFKLLALKDALKSLPEFRIKEMHDVVFQGVVPEHLKMLENCSQILINETTLPSEVFRSSWLNVDGQPADVDNVLGEPISDHNLTWSKKVTQSVSDSVVNVVDSLGQTGTDNAKDLGEHAHKDIPKAATDSIPKDIFHSDPEHSTATLATSDCKANMKILDKGCVSRTTNEPFKMQGESKKRLDVEVVNENKQAFTEPSLTNNSDVFDKTDISDKEGSTSDLPNVILLSSEEAGKIFSECFGYDQKTEPHQLCQEERKDLVTHCVKNQSNSVKKKPSIDFKFTCPHVTSLGCSSDFFCPSCWNETPLLDIDQDETLLTSKEGEPTTDYWRQSCSPQSGKPIEYPSEPVGLESSSIIKSNTLTPKSEGSDVMRNPKLGDQTQSSSPPPAQELHHGIASNKNCSVTKPVSEDLQINLSSAGTKAKHLEKEVADTPPGSQIIKEMVSQSRNISCKHVKSSDTEAVSETNDNLFSADLVISNTSTYKQHPSDHRSLSTDDRQCTVESKESYKVPIRRTCLNHFPSKTNLGTPSKPPNINGTGPQIQNKPIIKEKGHTGQSKEAKQMRLKLYGSNSGSSSGHHGKKPIYLTISASPITGKSYIDNPPAKQKVYSQWRTAFIRTQKNPCTYKNRRKNMEDQLKSKIQTLKIDLKNRLNVNLQKQQTEGLKHKRVKEDAENDSSQESKKLKLC